MTLERHGILFHHGDTVSTEILQSVTVGSPCISVYPVDVRMNRTRRSHFKILSHLDGISVCLSVQNRER